MLISECYWTVSKVHISVDIFVNQTVGTDILLRHFSVYCVLSYCLVLYVACIHAQQARHVRSSGDKEQSKTAGVDFKLDSFPCDRICNYNIWCRAARIVDILILLSALWTNITVPCLFYGWFWPTLCINFTVNNTSGGSRVSIVANSGCLISYCAWFTQDLSERNRVLYIG